MHFPLDMVLNVVVNDVLAPGLIAAAVLSIGWLLVGRRAAFIGALLALCAGFAAGNWLDPVQGFTHRDWFRGLIPICPDNLGWRWLFWTTLMALAVGLLTRVRGWPERLAWVVPATAALAACLLVPNHVQKLGLWPVALFTIVVAAEWTILDDSACRGPGGGIAMSLCLVFLAGAIVLIHAGCTLFFEAAVILAGSLGVIGAMAWLGRLEVGSVAPGAVVALAGLLLAGFADTFSQVPAVCFFLVALAPLLLGVKLLPPVARMQPLPRLLVQTSLLLVPLIAAVILRVCTSRTR